MLEKICSRHVSLHRLLAFRKLPKCISGDSLAILPIYGELSGNRTQIVGTDVAKFIFARKNLLTGDGNCG